MSFKPASNKKYYFEFVGQHTAGKTTIIRHIVDDGLLLPQCAVYPQKIKRSQVNFLSRVPVLFIRNIVHLCFVFGFFLRYAKINWINYHAAGRHMWKMVILHPYYNNFDFDVWMKDDLLHLLPRIEFRKGVDVALVFNQFFKHFSYLYDGVVYIDLPYEVMHERFGTRFANRPEKRRLNRAPVYERAFTQNTILKQVLEDQTIVPLLVIDGTQEVKDNASRVVDFIKTHIHE